ncbi:MAG TPA: formate dehydrogenase subunit gamma [Pirellulaceae bacterium]|nr:formate dehydrogenase subunit gamma [Pirellulaceae bacterium]HMO90771.1 formate dehydrogenase subunit gamma [Pirellulaceae bacterium]HMP68022.1 formate dehydrogenase subunit gamma [Pirellulaceae bacterium]
MGNDSTRIAAIADKHRSRPGATLPILHDIQAEYGYIPDEAVPIVAETLNLSRAEIHGVITFYADFRTTPPGRHIVQVCRGEACQAKGGEALEEHAKKKLGVDFHETTADQNVTLEPVFCLGNCGCSPSVRVGDEILGRVDAERFNELLDELRGKEQR